MECSGLATATVSVIRVAKKVSGHITIKPYPKSKAGRRRVAVPPFVVQFLTEHARTFRHHDQVLVFTTGTGQPIRRGTFRSRVWKPLLQRAGLPAALRLHDLRHCYATRLITHGWPGFLR